MLSHREGSQIAATSILKLIALIATPFIVVLPSVLRFLCSSRHSFLVTIPKSSESILENESQLWGTKRDEERAREESRRTQLVRDRPFRLVKAMDSGSKRVYLGLLRLGKL